MKYRTYPSVATRRIPGGSRLFNPPVYDLTVAGISPAFWRSTVKVVPTGFVLVGTAAPSLLRTVIIAPASLSLGFTGRLPGVVRPIAIATLRGTATVSGIAPLSTITVVGAGPTPLALMATVSTPVFDKVEAIGISGTNQSYWGGHQGRITRHLDGSIRAMCQTGGTAWSLMKKNGDNGSWAVETSGGGTDDVFLFRDQLTDRAIVLYSEGTSDVTVKASPSFVSTQMPGPWNYDGRDYSGAGIGEDGVLAYTQSDETTLSGGSSQTNNTRIECNSGKFNGTSWSFENATRVVRSIGDRRGYGYLFPLANGKVISVAQIDMNIPQITQYSLSGYGGFQYIFNGIDVSTFTRTNTSDYVNVHSVPYFTPINNATCPERRQEDCYTDTSGRIFVNFHQYTNRDSPANNGSDGMWTYLLNADGSLISSKFWSILPNYGRLRMFQDYTGAYWMLWTNSGTLPQCRLFPLTVSGGVMSASSYTDLAPPMISAGINFNDNSTLYISCPRTGNPVRNYVDCTFFYSGAHYYMRLRLPTAEPAVPLPKLFLPCPSTFYPSASPSVDESSVVTGTGGIVKLQPVLDPGGSGRTVFLHRIIRVDTNPSGINTNQVTRAERLWIDGDAYMAIGVKKCYAFAFMPKISGGEFMTSGTPGVSDEEFIVMQTHSESTGDTSPPIAVYMCPGLNKLQIKISNSLQVSGYPHNDYVIYEEALPTTQIWYKIIIEIVPQWDSAGSPAPLVNIWMAKGIGNETYVQIVTNESRANDYKYPAGQSYPRIGFYKWGGTTWQTAFPTIAGYFTTLYGMSGSGLLERGKAALQGL